MPQLMRFRALAFILAALYLLVEPGRLALAETSTTGKSLLTQHAEDLFAAGTDAYARGEYLQALQFFKNVLEIVPDNPVVMYNLGVTHAALNEVEKAIYFYNTTLSLKQDYVEAIYNLGTVYQALQDYERAEHYFTETLRLSPKFTLALRNLGTIRVQKGDTVGALALLKNLYRENPNDASIVHNLALTLLQVVRFAKPEQLVYKPISLVGDPQLEFTDVEFFLQKSLQQSGDQATVDLWYTLAILTERLNAQRPYFKDQREITVVDDIGVSLTPSVDPAYLFTRSHERFIGTLQVSPVGPTSGCDRKTYLDWTQSPKNLEMTRLVHSQSAGTVTANFTIHTGSKVAFSVEKQRGITEITDPHLFRVSGSALAIEGNGYEWIMRDSLYCSIFMSPNQLRTPLHEVLATQAAGQRVYHFRKVLNLIGSPSTTYNLFTDHLLKLAFLAPRMAEHSDYTVILPQNSSYVSTAIDVLGLKDYASNFVYTVGPCIIIADVLETVTWLPTKTGSDIFSQIDSTVPITGLRQVRSLFNPVPIPLLHRKSIVWMSTPASSAAIENEMDVMNLLRRKLPPGYELKIIDENISFEDRVWALRNAIAVAGLTFELGEVAICSEGTNVLDVNIPLSWPNLPLPQISAALGLKYHRIQPPRQSIIEGLSQNIVQIPWDALESAIDDILSDLGLTSSGRVAWPSADIPAESGTSRQVCFGALGWCESS